jgi:hypothetical protein
VLNIQSIRNKKKSEKQILIGPRVLGVVSGNPKRARVKLAAFLRKSELVNVQCGSLKNFKGLLKIKESILKFFKVQRLMSLVNTFCRIFSGVQYTAA